ncbi:MAG: DUF126 domain-containing protein [Thermoanaerobaculia bacterium]
MTELRADRVLVDGEAVGELVVLTAPLSLWGGLDAADGTVIDPRHPQHGARLGGRIVALPVGRGSSSASSILLESVRLGTAPSALLTLELDPILALGAVVARELYGRWPVVAVLGAEAYGRLAVGSSARIERGGRILVDEEAGGR